MADAERDSSSSINKREPHSGSTEKRTATWYQLMREDQKLAMMVFVLGVALTILFTFAVITLFSSPPRQPRRVRSLPLYQTPGPGDVDIKNHDRKPQRGTGHHDHSKEGDSDDDDYKRRKVRVARARSQRKRPERHSKPKTVTTRRPAARAAARQKQTRKHIKIAAAETKQPKKKTVKTGTSRTVPKQTQKQKQQHRVPVARQMSIKTRSLPAQPIVCVVDGQATAEVSYPEDGLCDAVVFDRIFYHSGELSTGKEENGTFREFLAAAKEAKQSTFMVSTDRHFATYETVPPGPNLHFLHEVYNIRGFGYLGIRVQSAQGAMLEVYTSLLRSQIEDMHSILKSVGVADSTVFLGVTTEEHMFNDEIVTNALKSVITTVRVHLVIVETQQVKHSECMESPITSWRNASGVAFDEPTATAAWMARSGMRPLLPGAAIAFSSTLAAMRFWLNGQTTVTIHNRLYRCFAFSLSAYDKEICKMERRYHAVSDTFFAQEQGSEGLYVYEDAQILGKKVEKAKRAMNLTENVGWAFYGVEFEGDGEDACGSPFDRISAVRKVLRSA
ncbi:uncharacterized protein LOC144158090 [Haemaphysalis longicornis]